MANKNTPKETKKDSKIEEIKIAIIGRPNVGKSTLFNRLVGKQLSVVHKTPGVTRDRQDAPFIWKRQKFILMDTGGVFFENTEGKKKKSDPEFQKSIEKQALAALSEAHIILFMMARDEGITPYDQSILKKVRPLKIPMIGLVNKVDHPKHHDDLYPFYEIGFKQLFGISAAHGQGIGDVLDAIMEAVSETYTQRVGPKPITLQDDVIRFCVVGKPNVGKSSLSNLMAGSERTIVSDTPGTTRSAIEIPLTWHGQKFVLVDTAGVRRKAKVHDVIEKDSIDLTEQAISQSHVVIFMFDISQPISDQDQNLAGLIEKHGKACIIVGNKWDLVKKDNSTYKYIEEDIKYHFRFLHYAPILFISVLDKIRTHNLYEMVKKAYQSFFQEIEPRRLNEFMENTVHGKSTSKKVGRGLKIFFTQQVDCAPPTLVTKVNDPRRINFSYRRFLENRLREQFGFEGSPILWSFRK